MIPISLSLSGFLSYRDPVEINFESIQLACISGANGAGKSSLLDAMTWALFGQARKRDEALIHQQAGAAEVALVFEYESNRFRVQRTLPRGKTSQLEFQIWDEPAGEEGRWRVLTEHTQRETQERIIHTLRLDYETFVNAAFFLQGKADQFTQQRPNDRKRILGSILGLDAWEAYRTRTAARRKTVEAEIEQLDGRLAEINAELDEESTRRQHLDELQDGLKKLTKARQAQEKALESIRRVAATLAEQARLVETLARQLQSAQVRYHDLSARLLVRQEERQTYAEISGRAAEIEAAYAAWQAQRAEASRLDEAAVLFRQHDQRRQAPLTLIEAERARLLNEQKTLQAQQAESERQQTAEAETQAQRAAVQEALATVEATLARRAELEREVQLARQRQAEARAENPRLKAEMDELKERMDQLQASEGAACPLCGQPLSPEDRQRLVESLGIQGTSLGDRYRANQALVRETDSTVADLEARSAALADFELERMEQAQALAQLTERLDQFAQARQAWLLQGAPQLAQVTQDLAQEQFAPAARQALALIDAELKATGYDPAAHDAARRAEMAGRAAEVDFHALEKARAALAPLEREVQDLEKQRAALQADLSHQQEECQAATAALAAAQAQAPDLDEAERHWLDLQEQENALRMQVGAARQKVDILQDLKTRRKSLDARREEQALRVGRFKALERAFGKDGVPALLIEQALPQIEARANDVLDRLSSGTMTVRFVTQGAYKDKRREDLKETLDIQISDSSGTRDYELFSGGEAFRVNFAIRLALSEVLAQRAGARLQTLVIDEGFGSQDTQGRQRLVEAINLVRPDFAKILVITHIDELKDSFPTRIEVEKGERGSMVRVV